ncbi:Hypothetical protein PENO1_053370 [Penicillium occitanis (nom. inval.)]|nr:Hypothetical protein PENO1_053370 [Penicillium occitanis (nom. inval.)]PCH04911.1 hypothetical protein PENOC_031380 [Penicillium occitanis (nom. inval.)]
METTTAAAIATVTVTATAIPHSYPQPNGNARTGIPYGFIALIIILGLLLLLSLGCVGHGILARRHARRRGEDPGPVFGYWWWQSRPPPPPMGQGHGLQPVYGLGMQGDARGREFYNVAGGTAVGGPGVGNAAQQDVKGGGEVGMARYA